MKTTTPIEKHHGRYLPWAVGSAAFLGLAGTLWALSEVLENDSDGDGWTDAEEIVAETNPADETDPWDSDGDGIADYLEFIEGTDPLNPNDPPQARGASTAYSVAATVNEATESGDDSATPILSLPAPTWSSQQNMWHNTAWFGERLNYSFYTPAESSKWQALTGSEIEYWSPGYYDLLARNGSKGIAVTLENLSAGKYALKWKHLQRPDGGEPAYTVSVSGTAAVSKSFTAPACNSEDEAKEVYLTFEVSERGNVTLSFSPTGTGTSGPLIGNIKFRSVARILSINIDAETSGCRVAVKQDNGNPFTGDDWEASRERKSNPIAFYGGTNLILKPNFESPLKGFPESIRARVRINKRTIILEKAWETINEGIVVSAPVGNGVVCPFGKNFSVTWFVKYEGEEEWFPLGRSRHELYFLHDKPSADCPHRQESLFGIACISLDYIATEREIFDKIWEKFTAHDMYKRNGDLLGYWGRKVFESDLKGEFAKTFTLEYLLDIGSGRCQAWAELMYHALKLHGLEDIKFKIYGIVPMYRNRFLINNYEYNPEFRDSLLLEMRNVSYTEATQEGIDYAKSLLLKYNSGTYVLDTDYNSGKEIENRIRDLVGLRAKGERDPISIFSNHAIVMHNAKIYDPSYGVVYDNLHEWQKNVVAGFLLEDFKLGVSEIKCRAPVKNEEGEDILEFDLVEPVVP